MILLSISFGTAIADVAYNMPSKSMKKNYARIDGGYSYIGKKFSSDYATKPDGAFVGSVGVGYMVNSKFRTDVTAIYRGQYKTSQNASSEGNSYNSKQDISSVALMLSGYLMPKGFMDNYPRTFERLEPYLMVGVGGAVNKAGDIVATSSTASTKRTLGNQKRNFAWQVGVGALFEVTKCLAIDAMYKYVDIGNVKTHDLIKVETINHGNASAIKAQLRFHEFSLGMNFKF